MSKYLTIPLKRLLCFLNGNHFVRRTPEILLNPTRWRTRVSCRCGLTDIHMDGLVGRDAHRGTL